MFFRHLCQIFLRRLYRALQYVDRCWWTSSSPCVMTLPPQINIRVVYKYISNSPPPTQCHTPARTPPRVEPCIRWPSSFLNPSQSLFFRFNRTHSHQIDYPLPRPLSFHSDQRLSTSPQTPDFLRSIFHFIPSHSFYPLVLPGWLNGNPRMLVLVRESESRRDEILNIFAKKKWRNNCYERQAWVRTVRRKKELKSSRDKNARHIP